VTRDRIFVSYRRSDSAGTSALIRKTLEQRFAGSVFQDVVGIDLGARFPDTLNDELLRSRVVLAVIGPGWLEAKNEFHQRRIDFPDDWVHIELSTALADHDVTVIPVLVDEATMPPAKALPAGLADLSLRSAVTLRHDAWEPSCRPLLASIEQLLHPGQVPSAQPAPPVQALTLDLVRQAVIEAFDARAPYSGHVILATTDELARYLSPEDGKPRPGVEMARLDALLRRLIGRPVVQVAGYMSELLQGPATVKTTTGRWLCHSVGQKGGSRYVSGMIGCVLIMPGPDAKVRAAGLASVVNWDFYGMPSNNDLPFVSADFMRVVGAEFGSICDAFPSGRDQPMLHPSSGDPPGP
jgi:hypothetical protein